MVTRRQYSLPPKILETAFKLPAGGESEITELGDGQYFAVRVEKIAPPHQQALNEIRQPVTEAWMRREVVRQLEAKAQALVVRRAARSRSRRSPPLPAPASCAFLACRARRPSPAGPRRRTACRAFGSKPGEVWSQATQTGLAIGRIDNVRMEGGPTAARLAEEQRGQLSRPCPRNGRGGPDLCSHQAEGEGRRGQGRVAAGFEPKAGGKGQGGGESGEEGVTAGAAVRGLPIDLRRRRPQVVWTR